MTQDELTRADERDQIADMLQAWAQSVARSSRGTDWEHGYVKGLTKASRLVRGDE